MKLTERERALVQFSRVGLVSEKINSFTGGHEIWVHVRDTGFAIMVPITSSAGDIGFYMVHDVREDEPISPKFLESFIGFHMAVRYIKTGGKF